MYTFNYVSLLPQQCEVCESRGGLLRCTGCHVAFYCGRDHQLAHRNSHKHACNATKKAHTKYTNEETSLRNKPSDFALPARVFEEHAGHFWGILDTRDYMRARFGFVDSMLSHFPRHRMAVQTALDHLMDMMRLNRSDNMGLRNKVPSLMLRLGRDQDAYDYVKWWATCDPDGRYDWGNMDLPYLNVKAVDILEEPTWWTGEWLDLSHASAVMLIKLRVLLKLRELQNTARALSASPLPTELVNQVRGQTLAGSPLARRRDLADADTATIAAMIEGVKKQIWALYLAVEDANMHFWPLLVIMQDGQDVKVPDYHSRGSPDEAALMMLYNYPSWEETPGALDEIAEVFDLHIGQVAAAHRYASFDKEEDFSEDEDENEEEQDRAVYEF